MKDYLLFAYNINGLGGAQQYYVNRIKFLNSIGYNVSLYSSISENIGFRISFLDKYLNGIFNEFNYIPSTINKIRRTEIINVISNKLGNTNDILIESTGGYLTIWAELLASILNCKHICFNLNETHLSNYSKNLLDFFFFKYQRNELFGISKYSLKNLFRDVYDVSISQDYTFSPVCTNVIDDTIIYKGTFPSVDFNVGGIWRTNKAGFLSTMDELYKFFNSNFNYKFNLIIIGSGSKDNENIIKKQFSSLVNVNLFILGYLYPIPKSLLDKIDVFVSTAGSVRVSSYCNRPTISVTTDLNNKLYSLGIFNYTTLNTNVPEETGKSLSDYLNMVLIDRYCSNHDVLDKKLLHHGDVVQKNEEQMDRFNSNIPLDYYDVLKIQPETFKEKVNSFLYKTIGLNATSKLRPLLHLLNSAFHGE